jgi:poly-gamma-glutamate capsule biosynthesis protein CapA/YwtB (metallophosphatase superfamily)
MNEARNPAILPFCKRKIAVFSFSDHGCGKADISTRLDLWTAGIEHQEGINLIDIDLFTYLTQYRDEMKTELIKLLKTPKLNGSAEFVIVSIHWGPNYAWMPS